MPRPAPWHSEGHSLRLKIVRDFVGGGVSPTVVEGCAVRKELGDRSVFVCRMVLLLFVEGSEGVPLTRSTFERAVLAASVDGYR